MSFDARKSPPSSPPLRKIACAAGLAAATLLALAPAAMAQSETKIGTLSCDVSSGVGMFVVQKQTMTCSFKPMKDGPVTAYTGKIETYGVALGAVEKGHLVWGVVAKTNNAPPVGALAGKYVGASADAAFGPGLGANVLIGGSDKAFALQPISVEGQLGVNIAAGVTALTLTASP